MESNNRTAKIQALEDIVRKATPEDDNLAMFPNLKDYLNGEHIPLVGNSKCGQVFNLYWQDTSSKLLAVDLIHYYGHIISTPLAMANGYIYIKEREMDDPDFRGMTERITKLKENTLGGMKRLKEVTGEVLNLYELGYINFDFLNFKHEDILKDFTTIQEQLAQVVMPVADEKSYHSQLSLVVNKLVEIRSKYQKIYNPQNCHEDVQGRMDSLIRSP